ncbi:MAG: ATP-dependent DNA helicase RecG [Phormidium sp. GEM2.Bin31]|nr:MAG: ATP-dependent DNA helicase RecG [Phormidium sp. GEM2.Bin31]
MVQSPSVDNAPDWERLRKALSVEAERGFSDLLGREYRFHEFLQHQFNNPPARLAANDRQRWQNLAAEFAKYPSLTLAQRQHLVAESQRVLLHSQRSFEMRSRSQRPPVTPRKPPTVELQPQVAPAGLSLDQPLSQVRQIGRRGGDRLARLGLYRVQDLLEYFPRDRIDYARQVPISQLEPGETVTVVAQVQSCSFFNSSKNKKLSIFQLTLKDPTGRLKITRFYPGNRYSSSRWQYAHKSQYPRGATVAASGLVKKNKYGITLENPDLEVLEHADARIESLSVGRVLPVYALTDGVTADLVRKSVLAVLPASQQIPEPLPKKLREKYDLLDRSTAIANIHFPPDTDILDLARRRLVFDEFFYLQLGLLKRRHELKQAGELQLANSQAQRLTIQGQLIEQFYNLLPFDLTHAQTRVIQEILGDLNKTSPMNRLVQGDVGAGKTVVAVVAILAAIQSGYQAALMAPTEVLAEQHYRKLVDWLNLLQLPVELLTGSTKTRKRRQIHSQLETGELPVLVGTHALIQDKVNFHRLGLAVIDEQHRFGVQQRAKLQQKGSNGICHVLSMTATPIPRTLALTLHGDLDVSQIDELPPGRKPIQTTVLAGKQRLEAYDLIRRQMAMGHQAYVVLPLVEESEKLDLKSAVEEYERLQEVFPNFRVGLLHGRMTSAEKDAAIAAFHGHDTQILVSTTVVEVGVDVPNATVMLIENAERFGLSQLHQLRGRVGRGGDRAYCILMTHPKASPDAKQRLEVLESSQDGFLIAEMDMQLRGPGQMLGTRQSGLPDFVLASLVDDREVLILARDAAERVIRKDPSLERYPRMKAELEIRFERMLGGAMLQ